MGSHAHLSSPHWRNVLLPSVSHVITYYFHTSGFFSVLCLLGWAFLIFSSCDCFAHLFSGIFFVFGTSMGINGLLTDTIFVIQSHDFSHHVYKDTVEGRRR